MRIVETVIEVNEARKRRMVDKITDLLGGSVNGKKIAVLGVTFKPETDDMRDSPSLTIVPALVGGGASVSVTDPEGRKEGEKLLPGVRWAEDAYAAAVGAEAVVLLTEWNQFRALDLARLRSVMAGDAFIDLRNVYDPQDAARAGFRFKGVGRG
jgi:UDPglucose 6-dehydrogenase